MLSIRKLTAGYGKLEILHNVSIEMEATRMTAILGPNGSGKSTLLKSIFGLTNIMGGSIIYKGNELVGMPPQRVNRLGIAYVPQRQNIFPTMTVRENLALAVRRVQSVDALFGIGRAFELFPTLAKRQNQRAGLMSGGERQMVAIAMGWLMQPSVMLLDEPTAGLAPVVAKEVFQTLGNLSEQGIKLVIVEQNARTALKWCDDVYIFREGELAYEGVAKTFRENDKLLHQYLGLISAPVDSQAE